MSRGRCSTCPFAHFERKLVPWAQTWMSETSGVPIPHWGALGILPQGLILGKGQRIQDIRDSCRKCVRWLPSRAVVGALVQPTGSSTGCRDAACSGSPRNQNGGCSLDAHSPKAGSLQEGPRPAQRDFRRRGRENLMLPQNDARAPHPWPSPEGEGFRFSGKGSGSASQKPRRR